MSEARIESFKGLVNLWPEPGPGVSSSADVMMAQFDPTIGATDLTIKELAPL